MRTDFRIRGVLAVVLAITLMIPVGISASGALAADEAVPNPAGDCKGAPITTRAGQLCGPPIVFADANSGDLWITDEFGTGPFRLTRTPGIEDNPSAMGFWIAYDVTPRTGGNRDIFMLSLLGGGRLQLTGLKSDDFDPTLASPVDIMTGFGMPIVFSSDRQMGRQGGKCGIELFVEVYGVFGPYQRVSECNRVDKLDAEMASDNSTVAFTGIGQTGDMQVWWLGAGNQEKLTSGQALSGYPSWAPGGSQSSSPTPPSTTFAAPPIAPAAAAGNQIITYSHLTAGGGDLYNLDTFGGSKAPYITAPANSVDYLAPEWDVFGTRVLFVRAQGVRSQLGWAFEDGTIGDQTVTSTDFYVTAADWANFLI